MEPQNNNINQPTELVPVSEIEDSLRELTDEQKEKVANFAKTIDLSSPVSIMSYGEDARKRLDTYTDSVLTEVKNKDLGSTGELITSVITRLKDCQLEEPKGIGKFFGRGKKYVVQLKSRYESANTSIESIVAELESKQTILAKDIMMLDTLYTQAEEYYQELCMYIAAGKQALKLAEAKAIELQQRALTTGSQMDAQRFKNFMNQMRRFKQKISDLELTKAATQQLAPQIILLNESNNALTERLQSTIYTVIPMWKQQLLVSLGIENTLQAAALQKLVSDTTNELMKRNAERLHQATVQTATELERGIIDVETLEKVNSELIATLTDVLQIQRDGDKNRELTSATIKKIEGELKAKLLETAGADFLTLPASSAQTPEVIEATVDPFGINASKKEDGDSPMTLKLKP